MATFSTLTALEALSKSIPDWNRRLDELNGQIALRQAELARLEGNGRPQSRSVRNKGSTESLRPRDQYENPFFSSEVDDIQLNPFDTPRSNHNGFSVQRPTPATNRAPHSPPPSEPLPHPSSPPNLLTRQTSQPTPTHALPSPGMLRKRKTDSLASAESQAPKYRTRSMIIVYYDSAVQQAFEDLVKFISSSRNAMRKGKMAAKMARMKRAAELEMGDDDDDDDNDDNDDGGEGTEILTPDKRYTSMTNGSATRTTSSEAPKNQAIPAGDSLDDLPIPKLEFVSTRQMGPSRDQKRIPPKNHQLPGGGPGGVSSGGIFRTYRRCGADEAPDIFDELDKRLEWTQAQCEHAAHQFLRDGDCSVEITNIKKKLIEVQDVATTETEKLAKEEKMQPKSPVVLKKVAEVEKTPEKTPSGTRDFAVTSAPMLPPHLEVDDMEVDDEEDDEEDFNPANLVFTRSRDLTCGNSARSYAGVKSSQAKRSETLSFDLPVTQTPSDLLHRVDDQNCLNGRISGSNVYRLAAYGASA